MLACARPARCAFGWPYYARPRRRCGLVAYHWRLIRGRTREGCFRAFMHNNWIGAAVFAGIVLGFRRSWREHGPAARAFRLRARRAARHQPHAVPDLPGASQRPRTWRRCRWAADRGARLLRARHAQARLGHRAAGARRSSCSPISGPLASLRCRRGRRHVFGRHAGRAARRCYGFFRTLEALAQPAAGALRSPAVISGGALGGVRLARQHHAARSAFAGAERVYLVRGRDTLLLDFAEALQRAPDAAKAMNVHYTDLRDFSRSSSDRASSSASRRSLAAPGDDRDLRPGAARRRPGAAVRAADAGIDIPVLGNLFGTVRRVASRWASRTTPRRCARSAGCSPTLREPEPPQGAARPWDKCPLLQAGARTWRRRSVSSAPCQEVVLGRQGRRPGAPAGADLLAGGCRAAASPGDSP